MSSLTDRSRSRAIALHSDTLVRSPKWLCPHIFQSRVKSSHGLGRHRSPGALTCARLAGLCAYGTPLHRASTSLQQLSPALRRGAFFMAAARKPANL